MHRRTAAEWPPGRKCDPDRPRHLSALHRSCCRTRSCVRAAAHDPLGDIDCLYVHKLLDAIDGKLPSVAAFLDATEGKARIGAHGFVDEDATTLKPFGSDVLAVRQVAGDDAAAQP